MSWVKFIKAALLAGGVALAALSGAGTAARADIIFSLDNVVFEDGRTISGTFTLNVYGYFLDWDITTSTGASFTGFHYLPPLNPSINNPLDTITIFNRDSPDYFGYLQLTFSESLTGPLSLPGHDPLVLGGASYECDGYQQVDGSCTGHQSDVAAGGAVEPVPEPAPLAVLAAALIGLGIIRYRRKR